MRTPCINVCSIDQAIGLCVGCGRTLQEIGDWITLSDDERNRLMLILPTRLPAQQTFAGSSRQGNLNAEQTA
jgi:predicted Fe-S protein YdhL (DUF1289 family)